MNGNKKLVGTVLFGLGAWALTSYVCNALKARDVLRARERKLLKREATQEWEGEGGALVAPKSSLTLST